MDTTPTPPAASPRRGWGSKLAVMLTLTPPAAAVLALERRFPQWWAARFPRSNAEIESDPLCLGTLLTLPSPGLIAVPPLPPGAQPHAQQRLTGLTHEPGKDRTTAKWEVTFRHGTSTLPLRVVTKLQSGRDAPLYMQAIRAVFERDFVREVAFYRHLAPHVPVRVARAWFADAKPSINRICLILEAIDGSTRSDADGCPIDELRELLDAAAALNGAFAGRLDDPATAWIPARAGLEFAEWVELFLGKETRTIKQLWASLRTYFETQPVALVHGDCRPGNMIFTGAGVVMSDWEAINIAPVLWDFTYCTAIGLRADDRQAHLDRLLQDFLAALKQRGGADVPYPTARVQVDLLVLVLAFVSICVVENRLWAQGNAMGDIVAWLERVRAAVAAIDSGRAATALSIDATVIREFQASAARRLVVNS